MFISGIFFFPIAVAINLLEVESIITFNIEINVITLPTTEKRPKSSTPKACNAKRVVRRPQIVLMPSFI